MTPEQETDLLRDVADTRADCKYFRAEILRHSQMLDGSPERGVFGLATNVALLLSRKANNNSSESYWLRKHFGKMLAAVLAALAALVTYVVAGK